MTQTATRTQLMLMRLVVVITVGLIAAGLIWYGASADVHQRIWKDIGGRITGPMTFRFVLQPTMAAIAAAHDGLKDERLGRAPFLTNVAHDGGQRSALLQEGLISISRIVLLGFAMDAIYQMIVFGTIYPAEMVIITVLLAVMPYAILRGLVTRFARWRHAARTPQ